jgi:hypothetical protein
VLLLTFTAGAEMEKTAVPCDTGICFYWWPKLPHLKGWHQDTDQSFHYHVNALAPDGSSFTGAETVMYAEAIYKPRTSAKSLDALIANDKRDFVASGASTTVVEVGGLTTGDGNKMRSFTFFPQSKGNWEQVSYGEEDEYYLVFTLSSRSKEGFNANQARYRELIAHYRAKM